MGFVYEVECLGTVRGKGVANIFHVWDGDENQTPDDVADVFENNHLPDCATVQADELTWNRINVTPLDVGNTQNAISRVISITGSAGVDSGVLGVHIWVKFISDDNGFKSGGKLFTGTYESQFADGIVVAGTMTALQTVYDDLLTDLTAAGLALAIYRPTLSTPGVPSISTCSAIVVRGVGTNNRRQEPFQN